MIDIVLGQLSEAVARALKSYQQTMSNYNARVAAQTQPSTPFINLFSINHQIVLLTVTNTLYLFITLILYNFMKSRSKGIRMRWFLLCYDGLNVLLAGYIFFSTIQFKLSRGGGMLLCNPISHEPEALVILPTFILFYIQKFIEFFDTWLFILRKSAKQITFLHLFHHASITIVVGFILPFDYNGDMYLPIMLNSFNHLAVYLHYLLATLGIRSPWSRLITWMQLAQFVIIFLQSLVAYRVGPTCGSPDFAKLLMIAYMGSMIVLFARFILQRFVFRSPNATTIDLCGVIKSPLPSESSVLAKTVQHCGTARLNDRGECHIALPDSFPDPALQVNPLTASKRFTFVYHLTPLHEAMPNLFVSSEVQRWKQAPRQPAAAAARQDSPSRPGSTKVRSADNLLKAGAEDSSRPRGSMMTLSTGGAIIKSKSFNNLSTSRNHNDRLIDGPLPRLFERPQAAAETVAEGKAVTAVTSAAGNSSAGSARTAPLCFSIAGGSPKGRVSWMVMTVPGEDNEDELKLGTDDWRAIN